MSLLKPRRALCFDRYTDSRATGSFILIDEATNATVAAGMITGPAESTALMPLAGISFQLKDGALILSSEQGFATTQGSGEPLPLEDAEALEALRHFLRRLNIAPFGAEPGEADWEI